eukprot:5018639-Pleurochrysis_carterae.AAC.2
MVLLRLRNVHEMQHVNLERTGKHLCRPHSEAQYRRLRTREQSRALRRSTAAVPRAQLLAAEHSCRARRRPCCRCERTDAPRLVAVDAPARGHADARGAGRMLALHGTPAGRAHKSASLRRFPLQAME